MRGLLPRLALVLASTLAGHALADGPLVPSPDGDPSTWQRIEFADGSVVKAVWEKHHFTPATVRNGERTVPRIYFAEIPARWGQTVAPELSVVDKKRTFLYGLVPAVLAVNEEVMLERRRLRSLTGSRKAGKAWTADQSQWMAALAARYGTQAGGEGYVALARQALRLPGGNRATNAPDVRVVPGPTPSSRTVTVVVRWQLPGEPVVHRYGATAVIGAN